MQTTTLYKSHDLTQLNEIQNYVCVVMVAILLSIGCSTDSSIKILIPALAGIMLKLHYWDRWLHEADP